MVSMRAQGLELFNKAESSGTGVLHKAEECSGTGVPITCMQVGLEVTGVHKAEGSGTGVHKAIGRQGQECIKLHEHQGLECNTKHVLGLRDLELHEA